MSRTIAHRALMGLHGPLIACSLPAHWLNCRCNRAQCSQSMLEIFCDSRESLQKSLAMLCDSELKCGLRLVARSNRSITELNSDSHSRRFAASNQEPTGNETHGFCGSASTPKTVIAAGTAARSGSRNPPPSFCPALHRPSSFAPRPPRRPGFNARAAVRAPRAEFISVSGQRTDRSAPGSDMRHSKRISGHAAATEPPHAPMNRSARRTRGGRVCLLSILI
jgi:hypothetical protein